MINPYPLGWVVRLIVFTLSLAALVSAINTSVVIAAGPAPDGRASLPWNGNTGDSTVLTDGAGVLWLAFRATDGPYDGSAVLLRQSGGSFQCVLCDLDDAYGTPELFYMPDGRARFVSTNRSSSGGSSVVTWWDIGESRGWVRVSYLSRASMVPQVQR